ncbi:MAG: hypothetical protein ACOCXQ_00425 [Patescibacteria group bacterium]
MRGFFRQTVQLPTYAQIIQELMHQVDRLVLSDDGFRFSSQVPRSPQAWGLYAGTYSVHTNALYYLDSPGNFLSVLDENPSSVEIDCINSIACVILYTMAVLLRRMGLEDRQIREALRNAEVFGDQSFITLDRRDYFFMICSNIDNEPSKASPIDLPPPQLYLDRTDTITRIIYTSPTGEQFDIPQGAIIYTKSKGAFTLCPNLVGNADGQNGILLKGISGSQFSAHDMQFAVMSSSTDRRRSLLDISNFFLSRAVNRFGLGTVNIYKNVVI